MYFVGVEVSVRDYPGDILTVAFSHCFNIKLGLLAGLRSVICLQNKIQCAVLALEVLLLLWNGKACERGSRTRA